MFEVNIRFIGGLLAAYYLSGQEVSTYLLVCVVYESVRIFLCYFFLHWTENWWKIDVSSNHLGYNPQNDLHVSLFHLSSPIKANRQILLLGLRSWWTLNPTIHLSFSVLSHLFSVHPIRSNFHAQPSSAPSIIGANTSNSLSTTSTTTVLPRIYRGGLLPANRSRKKSVLFLAFSLHHKYSSDTVANFQYCLL